MRDPVSDPGLSLPGAHDVTTAPARRPFRERVGHALILTAALVVVVLAFTLQVRPDQRVQWSPSSVLPETCAFKMTWGVDCPACGLTRSIIYLVDGAPYRSLDANHFGWLIAIAIAFQIPLRVAALTGRARWLHPLLKWQMLAWLGLSAVLIVSWAVRLAF